MCVSLAQNLEFSLFQDLGNEIMNIRSEARGELESTFNHDLVDFSNQLKSKKLTLCFNNELFPLQKVHESFQY